MTLRWSSPLLFNDVFDVARELPMGFTAEELESAVIDKLILAVSDPERYASTNNPRLRQLIGLLRTIPIEQRLAGQQDLRAALGGVSRPVIAGVIEEFQNEWRAIVPTMRILCLSEDNANNAMWGYYADSNRGVVLALRCIDAINSQWLLAEPVRYSDTLPALADKEAMAEGILLQADVIDHRKIFSDYCYAKTPHWAHEREWRVLSFAREGEPAEMDYYPFRPEELGAIYLGASIRPDDERRIRDLLVGPLENVEVFRCVPASGRAFDFRRI
jgi:hypothetical protein